jgi:hypothetical protein
VAGGAQAELADYLVHQRAWVACMHQHNVDLPDPDKFGRILLRSRDKGNPAFEVAAKACRSLEMPMPGSVASMANPKLTDAEKAVKRKYSACMQKHGAPDFPDPGPDGQFLDKQWNQTSAGATGATKACASIIGDPTNPGPGVG